MKCRPALFHFYSLFFVLFIACFLFYSSVCADEQPQFYTIQAGSYAGEEGALHLYQDLADILPESQRSYLRVEKVGSYFTVRLGKFENRDGAEKLFAQTEQQMPNALILQAYIKDERIVRLYNSVSAIRLALETEQAAAFAEQGLSASAGLSPGETGEKAEADMEGGGTVPELTPDAPVSGQEDSGGRSTSEMNQVPVADVVQQDRAMVGQISVMEENVAVVADLEKATLSQPLAISVEPGEVGAEEQDGGTEEVGPGPTVRQPDLTSGEDELAREQEGTVSEEQDSEDAGADEKNRYERLGQPAGLYPVRIIAILEKDLFGGKYHYPSKVHYDPIMDEIYVIGGSGKHPSTRIMIYDPDYFPVASLGEGRGIQVPKGMDMDAEGNIYIADGHCQDRGPCLMVLNPAFFQINEVIFNDIAEVPDNFMPGAVALSEDYIYVSGEFITGVLVLDRNFNFVRWLVPMKAGGIQEQVGDDRTHPKAQLVNDVVVDENGRIYMLCPDQGRIFVLDSEWNLLFSFGAKGGSTGKLSRPQSIAVDEARQVLYVADYMRHTILLYRYTDGKLLFEIGGLGTTPGWFRNPTHVEVDGQGNLIVADFFNHRVQVLLVP